MRAEYGRVDPVAVVGVVGVMPGGIVAVGDGDAKVGQPWRGVGVGERGGAAGGLEEWAREVPR